MRIIPILLFCVFTKVIFALHITADSFPKDLKDNPEEVIASFIQADVVIDGILNDRAWDSASKMSGFWIAGKNEPAKNQTISRVFYDSDNIYFAFACLDPKVGTEKIPRDSPMAWQTDCVEIFISLTGGKEDWYHFILTSAGSQWDGCSHPEYKKTSRFGESWDGQWTGAVAKTDFGWTAEIKIPFSNLFDTSKYRIGPGWVWRLKITREDYNPGLSEPEFSSYTKIGSSFQDVLSGLDLVFTTRNFISNPDGKILDKDGNVKGWKFYVSPGGKAEMKPDDTGGVRFSFENADNATIFFPVSYIPFPGNKTLIFTVEMKMEAKADSKAFAVIRYKNPEGKFIRGEGTEGRVKIVPDNQYRTYRIGFPVPEGFAAIHVDINGAFYKGPVKIYIKMVKLELGSIAIAGVNDWCITGNAMGPLSVRNIKVDGCYTYFDAGTDTYFFPRDKRKLSEENHRNCWIPFSEGKLTDGNLATGVGWPNLWTGSNGIDVVFDLGKLYNITRVEILSGYDSIVGGQLYLKKTEDSVYTLVDSMFDRVDAKKDSPKNKTNHLVLKANGSTARFIRINFLCNSYNGPAEIQVWGNNPDNDNIVPILPRLQQKGRIVIQKPAEIPLEKGMDVPFLPAPQEFKRGKSEFVFDPLFRIVLSSDSTERTNITAELLKEELSMLTGYEIQIDRLKDPVDKETKSIFLGLNSDKKFVSSVKKIFLDLPQVNNPEGYFLISENSRIAIIGADEPGLFYGCMSLLELLRIKNWKWIFPEISIRDWPVCPYRMMQVRPKPDKNFLRALARYKINYVEFNHRYNNLVVELKDVAEKYFIKTILGADPRMVLGKYLASNPDLIEKFPEEKLEDLGSGRRNICPSNPKTWELYFGELDKWIDHFTGFLDISFDEMYQTPNGSRWNVCQLCRSKNKHSYEILAETIRIIHEYVRKHGKHLMMFDTCFMGRSISNPEDTDPDWRKALDIIPKDTVMAVWHPDEVNELFLSKGFTQVYLPLTGKNWKKLKFPGRYYSGVLYYMMDSLFKVPFVLQESQACWSPDVALPGAGDPIDVNICDFSPHWEEIIGNFIYPSKLAAENDYFYVDISSVANNSFTDEKPFDGKGWMDMGQNFDLRAMAPGKRILSGVPFQIIDEKKNNGRSCISIHNRGYIDRVYPPLVEIPVSDKKVASFIFLHVLDNKPGHNYLRKNELAGYYFIVYQDGFYLPVELKYGLNIANWDGLPGWSYYEPHEKSMKKAILCWRGKTQAGVEANIYYTEWINPRPQIPVTKIIFATTWKKTCMNPTLIAITGIHYREEFKNVLKNMFTDTALKPTAVLSQSVPQGIPVELKGGILHNDLTYETEEKILITGSSVNNRPYEKVPRGGEDFKSDISCAISDSNDFFRPAGKGEVTFVFPKAEILSGVLVSGSYRDERKSEDFQPQSLGLVCYISADGSNFEKLSEILNYTPEEEGPKWFVFPDKPVKAFKIEVRPLTPYSVAGLNLVQPYRK